MSVSILHKITGAVLFKSDAANLTGAYLSGADLSGANLSGANLHSAYLRSANLHSADLSSAYLSGADLSGANLSGADLSGAYLRSANLRSAYLRSANLHSADLSGANLRSANLHSADLSGANLHSADLSGATLSTGETFERYLAEVVPALCVAGGRAVADVVTPEHWACNSWDNCPMAAAFDVHGPEECPPLLRPRVTQFIHLFDHGLIPLASARAACGLPPIAA